VLDVLPVISCIAGKAYTGKTDLSCLSAGIYYVRVYTNGMSENKKIIVLEVKF
jgi:hypothetical protein